MESIEKPTSSVTLTNEPKLSDQKADEHFNERRTYLVKRIQEFVAHHDLFKNAETKITFAAEGVSSLISIIEGHDKKMVLKIPLSTTQAVGEPQFLIEWANAGVHVPQVIETGSIDEHQYILMEYIDAPTLNDVYSGKELLERGIFFEMGKTLKRMHTPKGEGYGRVIDGHGEFKTFREWIDGHEMNGRIEYIKRHNLLGEKHGTFQDIRAILIEYVEAHPQSSYCHDDFGTHNIFATEPITVFDPNPRFNHPYVDVGRSLLKPLANGRSPESVVQFKEGYFGDDTPNEKALHASIVLACYMKFIYWNKIREKRGHLIEKAQEYLEENKHLLK